MTQSDHADIYSRPIMRGRRFQIQLRVTAPSGGEVEFHFDESNFLSLIANLVKTYEETKELNEHQ